jgi:hypothetical protein
MRLFVLLTVVIASFVPTAYAEECDGIITVLRISNYVEGGSEEGLRTASAAHQKWYREHGATENEQVVASLLKYGETDSLFVDTDRAATLHVNYPASTLARENEGNEGWRAFLAMYAANTEITETYYLCLPKKLLEQY